MLLVSNLSDDKPKGEMQSCAKKEQMTQKSNLMNKKKKSASSQSSRKISYTVLFVQKARMKEERKQTKILSYATQNLVLKSQIKSARQTFIERIALCLWRNTVS